MIRGLVVTLGYETSYPSDLSDREWQLLEPLLPPPKPGGRPITYPRRSSTFPLRAAQVAPGMLPHDLPPWQHRVPLLQYGVVIRMTSCTPSCANRGHHRQPIGEDHGKRGPRGYDAGKKVKGRKRHIVVDTLCRWRWQSRRPGPGRRPVGAGPAAGPFPSTTAVWADGAYGGIGRVGQDGGRLDPGVGAAPSTAAYLSVLPRRWVVEPSAG